MTPLSRGIISSGKLGGGVIPPSIFAANTANLNGTNQYFEPDSAISSGLSTISLYCKVKFDTVSTSQYLYYELTGADGFTAFGFNLSSPGFLTAAYRDTGSTHRSVTTASALSTGQWYSLLMTIDVDSAMKIYVDNVEGASLALSTPPIFSGAQFGPPTIGASLSLGSRSNLLNGSIAFMGSNSRIITATERADLLTSDCYDDLGTLQNNMIEYWELAEWSGHTGQALTGQHSANNLTNAGATPFTGAGLTVEC